MQAADVKDINLVHPPMNGAIGIQGSHAITFTPAIAGIFDPQPRLVPIYRTRMDKRLG
jgi:hypothetical protein